MIAALDVYYDEARSRGLAAAVVFHDWGDSQPAAEYTAVVEKIEPYVPGQFFRRELPCLLAVIAKIKEPLHLLIVDGYVTLDSNPGLGQHLLQNLNHRIPVIGVAKTRFHGATASEVFRGTSQSPLFITAAGLDRIEAANHIRSMHGRHRLPALLKRVDEIGRKTKDCRPTPDPFDSADSPLP
jgi:deoxyribonuclease V